MESPLFEAGQNIYVLECKTKLGHKKCESCDGFGTLRANYTYIDSALEFMSNPAAHPNRCPACMGVGKVSKKIRTTDWESRSLAVTGVRGVFQEKGKFKTEEVVCDIGNDEEEGFDPEDCFHLEREADIECDYRNNAVLFAVDFHGCVFLFDDMDTVLLWLRNFMINGRQKFNHNHINDEDVMGAKARGEYHTLVEASSCTGATTKMIKMNRLDYDEVTNFGGMKVLSGMPRLLDVQFGNLVFDMGDKPDTREACKVKSEVTIDPDKKEMTISMVVDPGRKKIFEKIQKERTIIERESPIKKQNTLDALGKGRQIDEI